MEQVETGPDGAASFQGNRAHVRLYSTLYDRPATGFGDIPFYDALAGRERVTILDAACGAGRISAALASPTRRITAFDASEELLAQAMAQQQVHNITYLQARLETFELKARFSLIILGYYGFSYLLRAVDRAACLENIARHLEQDGIAILHLPAPALLQRSVPAYEISTMQQRFRIDDGGDNSREIKLAVTRMEYDPETGVRTTTTRLEIFAGSDRLYAESSIMYYAALSFAEISRLATAAGLEIMLAADGFRHRSDRSEDAEASSKGAVTELVILLRRRDSHTGLESAARRLLINPRP